MDTNNFSSPKPNLVQHSINSGLCFKDTHKDKVEPAHVYPTEIWDSMCTSTITPQSAALYTNHNSHNQYLMQPSTWLQPPTQTNCGIIPPQDHEKYFPGFNTYSCQQPDHNLQSPITIQEQIKIREQAIVKELEELLDGSAAQKRGRSALQVIEPAQQETLTRNQSDEQNKFDAGQSSDHTQTRTHISSSAALQYDGEVSAICRKRFNDEIDEQDDKGAQSEEDSSSSYRNAIPRNKPNQFTFYDSDIE